MTMLRNIHPGEVLREEYLIPLGISAYRLAADIDVPQTRISEIINERRAITADTAERLGRYFDTTPEFWLVLQAEYDLEALRSEKGEELSRIKVCDKLRDAA
jgi:antitoxin HigA-1